ncbi:MAG: hypothetical protein IKO83_06760 [Oscillospiraceae bacterium]|nr:hypothetical protein [Oscillospiraceae bacterium]
MTSDYVPPVIHAEYDAIQSSVAVTDQELLTGMTASDNLDGDVSDSLVVVSKSKFIFRGMRRIKYAAFDKNNNVGVYERMLTYTDYVSPHFSLSQPLRFVDGNSDVDYLKNVSAYDCLDGDISKQIMITYGENRRISDTTKSQTINLQVTNSAGDTATLQLEALRQDYTSYNQYAPSLSEYLVYTGIGQPLTLSSYVNGVWTGNTVRTFADTGYDPNTDVSIDSSSVNYNAPGVYPVPFQLSRLKNDGVREYLGTNTLFVVVEG